MNNGVRTIISCPCCEKIFIENCRNTRHWREHKQKTNFKQFRKYLNLVLSRSSRPAFITQGTHIRDRVDQGDKEKHPVLCKEDKRSLLYQSKFITAKKRENFNRMCAGKEKSDLLIKKCERNRRFMTEDLKKMNVNFKKENVETKQQLFPKISHGSQSLDSDKTGSTVIKFSDENLKLDIFLPSLS